MSLIIASTHVPTSAVIAMVLATLLAVVDWTGVIRTDRTLRWVGKPFTMVALIAAALLAHSHAAHGVTLWIIVGLALSLAGDIFLLLLDERWFTAGLGSFLLAHIAYVVAMAQLHLTRTVFGMGIVAVAFGVGTLGLRVVKGAGQHDKALQVPVLVYVCVISAMVATASATKQPWLIGAALLFYASDLMLGWDRFVTPRKFSGLAVMVTYHTAQAGFVVFLLTR